MSAARQPCRIVTLKDGSQVRVQGDADPAFVQEMADKVRADQALRCHALSDVPMPELAQRIHGRATYWCDRYRGHDGPHRFPESGRIAEWDATTLSPTSPAPVPSPTADEHDDRPGESPASGRSSSQT